MSGVLQGEQVDIALGPSNYTPAGNSLEDHLEAIDNALGDIATPVGVGLWSSLPLAPGAGGTDYPSSTSKTAVLADRGKLADFTWTGVDWVIPSTEAWQQGDMLFAHFSSPGRIVSGSGTSIVAPAGDPASFDVGISADVRAVGVQETVALSYNSAGYWTLFRLTAAQDIQSMWAVTSGGNIRTKIAPQNVQTIASIANGGNENYDIPLSDGDGYYRMQVVVFGKRTTTGDERCIAFAVHARSLSDVASLSGPPEIIGGGNKVGLAITVSVTGNNVRVNTANGTGEAFVGRQSSRWEVEDLIP